MNSEYPPPGDPAASGGAGLPLTGTRVLDLGRALSGPFCATLLGDLGADVVKVEPLPGGDMMRGWGPFHASESVYFLSVNRNKRSVALDLRDERARLVLHRLAASADVLVENFRPGVMEALGLDDETIRREHPRLIHCAVTAFGTTGPYSGLPGLDQVAQAMGGLMSVTGQRGGEPTRVGVAIGDMLAGAFAALAVAAALAGRAAGKGGRRVGSSLLEGVLGVLSFQAQKYLSLGEVPSPQGNDHPVISPYGIFRASDGPLVIACPTEGIWRKLCVALGCQELVDDHRFADNTSRVANRADLTELLDKRLAAATRREWFERLTGEGIPAGPVADMRDVFSDPQVAALEVVQEAAHEDIGPVRLVRPPFEVDGRRVPVRGAAPPLGRHTAEVLREAGLSDDEIASLLESGVALQR